jgi:hypothetical protein
MLSQICSRAAITMEHSSSTNLRAGRAKPLQQQGRLDNQLLKSQAAGLPTAQPGHTIWQRTVIVRRTRMQHAAQQHALDAACHCAVLTHIGLKAAGVQTE